MKKSTAFALAFIVVVGVISLSFTLWWLEHQYTLVFYGVLAVILIVGIYWLICECWVDNSGLTVKGITVKEDAGGYPYIDSIELYDYAKEKKSFSAGDKVTVQIRKT